MVEQQPARKIERDEVEAALDAVNVRVYVFRGRALAGLSDEALTDSWVAFIRGIDPPIRSSIRGYRFARRAVWDDQRKPYPPDRGGRIDGLEKFIDKIERDLSARQ